MADGDDSKRCEYCGERGGYLHAHHLLPYADFPDDRMDLDNGITLCMPCHRSLHF